MEYTKNLVKTYFKNIEPHYKYSAPSITFHCITNHEFRRAPFGDREEERRGAAPGHERDVQHLLRRPLAGVHGSVRRQVQRPYEQSGCSPHFARWQTQQFLLLVSSAVAMPAGPKNSVSFRSCNELSAKARCNLARASGRDSTDPPRAPEVRQAHAARRRLAQEVQALL